MDFRLVNLIIKTNYNFIDNEILLEFEEKINERLYLKLTIDNHDYTEKCELGLFFPTSLIDKFGADQAEQGIIKSMSDVERKLIKWKYA